MRHDLLKGTEFLKRLGVIPAELQPQPAIVPAAWAVHTLPLSAPLPQPDAVRYLDGDPAPDRIETESWPPISS